MSNTALLFKQFGGFTMSDELRLIDTYPDNFYDFQVGIDFIDGILCVFGIGWVYHLEPDEVTHELVAFRVPLTSGCEEPLDPEIPFR
jgi:hypothetical protein